MNFQGLKPQWSRDNSSSRSRSCWSRSPGATISSAASGTAKVEPGSGDSGIDLDLDATLGLQQCENNDMRVGKVMPTLTMGHGHPPVQALAEPAMPGAQFVQHMAPVPVLAHQPGDPPLGERGEPAR